MLRLRIVSRVWARAIEADPEFDRTVEDYVNGGVAWILKPPPLVGEKVRHVIETGDYRFWLAEPKPPTNLWDYDIIYVQRLRPEEHTPRTRGAEIDTHIVVLPPTLDQKVGQADRLNDVLNQPSNRIIFLLRIHTYRQLPDHEREPVNMAWRNARYGRTAKRVFWKEDAIFLLTPTSSANTGPEVAANLAEILESTGAGRLINDPYEVKRALELVDKFGEDVTG